MPFILRAVPLTLRRRKEGKEEEKGIRPIYDTKISPLSLSPHFAVSQFFSEEREKRKSLTFRFLASISPISRSAKKKKLYLPSLLFAGDEGER